jgi:hypothetical protein
LSFLNVSALHWNNPGLQWVCGNVRW